MLAAWQPADVLARHYEWQLDDVGTGVSEFGAIVILAYNPKVVPVLVFERFQGFGLNAAMPVTVLLIWSVWSYLYY